MSFQFSSVGAGFAQDIVSGRAAGPGARTTYLALLTATPTNSTTLGTMAEVSAGGYARIAITWSVPSGTNPETHNTNIMTFGPILAVVTVTSFAVVSAASGTVGDFLAWGDWTTPRTTASGDSLQVAASGLSSTLN